MATPSNYCDWSNADLIKRVAELEAVLRAHNVAHATPPSRDASPTSFKKKPKKPAKPFDSSKYSHRYVALKFAYLGKNYNGFEYHANNTTPLPTVEEELWKALQKTRLIFPSFREGQSEDEVCWDGCEYSKCGRTDRGVSAFGQVIGLRVRSSRPKETVVAHATVNGEYRGDESGASIDDKASDETATQQGKRSEWDNIGDELPYIQVLNRVLPPDIRILAWCPKPPSDFSARFSCKERRYRYFFTNPAYAPTPGEKVVVGSRGSWLDIAAMRTAAKKLEGLHDFRNFCKVDGSKQISNFERRIFRADVKPVLKNQGPFAFIERPPFASNSALLTDCSGTYTTNTLRHIGNESHSSTAHTPPASRATQQQGQDRNSSPDPVISMIAKRVTSDPELKSLMKDVETANATGDQLKVFQRYIDDLKNPTNELEQVAAEIASISNVYYFEFHGSAFLWHQVRHLVAILFLVGQGYEDPSIVDKLLDVQSMPSRPVYEMASDNPLVLWDCIFPDPEKTRVSDHIVSSAIGYEDGLHWVYAGDRADASQDLPRRSIGTEDRKYGSLSIMENLWSTWRKAKIDEVLAGSLMDVFSRQGTQADPSRDPDRTNNGDEAVRVFDGSECPRSVGTYVPITKRKRLESPNVINAKFAARKAWTRGDVEDADADE